MKSTFATGIRIGTGLAALGVALAAGQAMAQSTGTLDFEKEIVVTGKTSTKGIGGVDVPDTTKAKATLTKDWIEHQMGGQSVNDLVNYLPSVSYTNNDPYGGTSGNFYIRGFDNTRVSETFDGVTLNDDGNYALYGGELLDSEVIDSVTVNLGTTDVDSPTSSATGSTVNFVSHMPSDTMGAKANGSYGTDEYYRLFGMIETGKFGPFDTKAWFSASTTENNSPYNNYGHIKRWEANGKIYQAIHDGHDDFISLAGFYVQLRNNFSGSDPLSNVPLAADNGTGFQYFPTSYSGAYYTYSPCTLAAANAGVADTKPNTCGTAFEYRPNPANLFNLRGAIKLTLADGLTFTADPSYQFTKANGGGTASAVEGFDTVGTDTTATGYINGTYYVGHDLNGDGDLLDKVTMYVPSQTKTHRVALTSSLRYEATPTQTLRLAYAFARSDITQTGEMGFLNPDGSPVNVYAIDAPVLDAAGNPIEKRDTESIAELNQISGEYRGQFFDKKLTVSIGVRAPFLHRQLDDYCFTRNGAGATSSSVCVFGATATAYAAATPYSYNSSTGVVTGSATPQTRVYNYNAVLPNIGATYKFPGAGEAFFNYSEGFQAPYTTSLYSTFYYPQGTPGIEPLPEKSDNFDLGYRYKDSRFSGQIDLWYTHYSNKLGSSFDTIQQITTYTNLGPVQRYGIDANASYKFTPHLLGYGFVSVLHSRIESDTIAGTTGCSTSALVVSVGQSACEGTATYLLTGGKSESAMPHFMIGGRLQGDVGPLTIGAQVKHTANRYVNDENVALFSSGNTLVANGTQVWGAKYPSYTTVDLDLRYKLWGKSYFQLNVTNLFNAYYVGSVSPNTSALQTGGTDAQVSPPRAVIGTISIAY
jgi:iron complex outermembrane receptor protein